MLESLYIENFAIIDKIQLDFHSGMTVITGETGAGKSIIIDAIGQLLGQRTQVEFVKKGSSAAFIEGVFTYPESLNDLLDEFHISKDDTIVVSKQINSDGKATVKMNYRNVSQTVLKKIMPYLLDIHCQFETHRLFQTDYHLELLDTYISNPIEEIKAEYQKLLHEYQSVKKKYDQLSKEEYSDEQYDFYISQCEEIDSLNLEEFDEDEFLKERKQLQDYEKNIIHFRNFEQYYNGYESILTKIKDSMQEINGIDDETVKVLNEQLYDAYYNIDEISSQIINHFKSFQFDEERFNEVQEMYYTLNRLKRKYGQSIEQILSYRKELDEKIDAFKNREDKLNELYTSMNQLKDSCMNKAMDMTNIRKTYAVELENKVKELLNDLYLPNVEFKFVFETVDMSLKGIDFVSIHVSTNAGQSLRPLQKVASGGELSRIMLAIKTACLSKEDSTIIFDEADTGVSGKVAEGIGSVMKEISKELQVICITHLPQVAGFANNHLYIKKQSDDVSTSVVATYLDDEQSVEELAKMISGKDITVDSLNHARQLKKV